MSIRSGRTRGTSTGAGRTMAAWGRESNPGVLTKAATQTEKTLQAVASYVGQSKNFKKAASASEYLPRASARRSKGSEDVAAPSSLDSGPSITIGSRGLDLLLTKARARRAASTDFACKSALHALRRANSDGQKTFNRIGNDRTGVACISSFDAPALRESSNRFNDLLEQLAVEHELQLQAALSGACGTTLCQTSDLPAMPTSMSLAQGDLEEPTRQITQTCESSPPYRSPSASSILKPVTEGCNVASLTEPESEQTECFPRTDTESPTDLVTGKWGQIVVELLNQMSLKAMYWPRDAWRSTRCANATRKRHLLVRQASNVVCNVMCSTRDLGGGHAYRQLSLLHRKVGWRTYLTKMLFRSCPRALVIDPHSQGRILWSVVGMMFMMYDLVVLPMSAFDLPDTLITIVLLWLGVCYWSIDIPVNFCTGVYYKSVLETRLWKVAALYAKSWFIIDLLIIVPSWFMAVSGTDASQTGQLRSVRFLRLMRFVKLIRLAKFEHLLQQVVEVINSPYFFLVLGIFKQMYGLVLFNHVIACTWFAVGKSHSDGWVHRLDFDNSSVLHKYLQSYHWSLTQFQGNGVIVATTVKELVFSVILLLLALMILACFVSGLTNSMMQLMELQHERTARQRLFRAYLSEHHISPTLSVRIRKYIAWTDTQKQQQRYNDEIFLILPTKMLMELQDEARSPVLDSHPFFMVFRVKFWRTTHVLCHEAIVQVTPIPGESVFGEGEQCQSMYFVESGHLRYVAQARGFHPHCRELSECQPAQLVRERDWVSEPALWTSWVHKGELTCLGHCSLLALLACEFGEITLRDPVGSLTASIYARMFVANLNCYAKTFTDIIDNDRLFEDESVSTETAWFQKASASHSAASWASIAPTPE